MIGRREALRMGKTLNSIAEQYARMDASKLLTDNTAKDVQKAVRGANEIMFQYYLIPRAIREEYYRKEMAADGVPMQDLAKRGM